MSLSTRAASGFLTNIKERGRKYFQSRCVTITQGSADRVDAKVRGSELYRVQLLRQGNSLEVSCSCPYFYDYGDLCKHLWATLLAAEEKGYLAPLALGSSSLTITTADGETMGDEGEEDEDEDENDLQELDGKALKKAFGDALGLVVSKNGVVWVHDLPPQGTAQRSSVRFGAASAKPQVAQWQRVLASLALTSENESPALGRRLLEDAKEKEVAYAIDIEKTNEGRGVVLDVLERSPRRDKQPGAWKPLSVSSARSLAGWARPADRRVLSFLTGIDRTDPHYYGYSNSNAVSHVTLALPVSETLIPELCQTGRCYLRNSSKGELQEANPIAWDEDETPWDFRVCVQPDATDEQLELRGVLHKNGHTVDITEPRLLTPGGLVFWNDRAARFHDHGAFSWVIALRAHGHVSVPRQEQDRLLEAIAAVPHTPPLDLPASMQFEEVEVPVRPYVMVRAAQEPPNPRPLARTVSPGAARLYGEVGFAYEDVRIEASRPGTTVVDLPRHRLLRRKLEVERAAMATLHESGFRPAPLSRSREAQKLLFEIAPKLLPKAVRTLTHSGWEVEAEGKVYRKLSEFRLDVASVSGIDWFELHGSVEFEGQTISLPKLLAGLRSHENTVVLDDGTLGVLPEEWLQQWGPILKLGAPQETTIKYRKSQAGLLDALLTAQPHMAADATFARIRAELPRFEGLTEAMEPSGFHGVLREYQREGLGWLLFLERFGLGGCLADDMGLGKTVQVLALLEAQREKRTHTKASLIVVPKSLLFNWWQEAVRFTPKLGVLEHIGTDRVNDAEHFDCFDVILTTYGTLRRDAIELSQYEFHYVILDEAQAIKNASSEGAKAVRLLRSQHRLALTGTPVENHLGELWSLFEFLNPGMLGSASVFEGLVKNARSVGNDMRPILQNVIRPFLLRRTKGQVAKDLPQKQEETLFCDLSPTERKLYDELRDHYRLSLLGRIEREGLGKSKVHILEALLRLRQAACHPGLIDKRRVADSSAKLDVLLEQLESILEEGHKALVFSQFTSLLAIVRKQLDKKKITYEYLDGKTRDRQARVERFQGDPGCPLFLISLKAGGVGLNLTAAEYVFLLDPWWNPAVEAQAIDRTHRIGQHKAVFAYRLLSRNTVEEKVAELQRTKRDLADAILSADSASLKDLSRDDLEMLLT